MTRFFLSFLSQDPNGESGAASRETRNLPISSSRRRRPFLLHNALARRDVRMTSMNDPLAGLGNQFDSLSLPGDVLDVERQAAVGIPLQSGCAPARRCS